VHQRSAFQVRVSVLSRFRPTVIGTLSSLAYLVLVLVVLGPAIDPQHEALAGGDWTDLLYPFFQFTQETFAREGRLPFWNPYIFSGQPHLVSMNVLALYPSELAALFTTIEPSTFYALDLIAHLWLAGSAMCWWLHRTGRSRSAAFMGGLSYMLGGHMFTLAAAGHPHWIRCLAWLPLLFACLERGRQTGRVGWFAGAGALLSLSVVGAAMQFVAFALLVGAVWILGAHSRGGPDAIRPQGGRIPVLARRCLHVAVMTAVAAGLGAVMWLPGLEYYSHSIRAAPPPGLAGQWAFSPWDVVALLVPEIWGTTENYFGPHLFRASTDYPGLLPLVLAVIGAWAAWRIETRWVVLALSGIFLALGPATLLGEWLSHVPVFSGFRTPLRWLSFTHFAACVLVAHGWDAIRAGARRATASAIGVLLVVTVATGVLAAHAPWLARSVSRTDFAAEHLQEGRVTPAGIEGVLADALRKGAVSSAVAAGTLGLLAAGPVPFAVRALAAWGVTAVDLLVSSAGYFIFAPPFARHEADPVVQVLLGLQQGEVGGFRDAYGAASALFRVASDEYFGLPNRRMPHGLHWASGYHGLPLARYHRLYTSALAASSVAQLSLLNVRYIVATGPPSPGWNPVATVDRTGGGRVAILPHPAPLPRAFLAGEVVPCSSFDQVLEELARPDWTPARMPTDSPVPPALQGVRLATRGSITYDFGRDEINASINLPARGLLVFSEAWYPAWKTFVDGVRVPVLRAYGALRAIAVPAGGPHVIRMTYDSWSFKIGLWLSTCTSMVLLMWLAGRFVDAPR